MQPVSTTGQTFETYHITKASEACHDSPRNADHGAHKYSVFVLVGADGKISAGNRESRWCTSGARHGTIGRESTCDHEGAFIFNTCDDKL